MDTNIGNIIITTGGTITPVDKMRVITNKSRGTTGAKITEYILENTANHVKYIVTGSGALPFIYRFQINPMGASSDLLVSSYQSLHEFRDQGRLEVVSAPYFDDYMTSMEHMAEESKPGDVAIIAAAVSDYGMKKIVDGKISSSHRELTLELERLPKVIDLVRQKSQSLVMLGFKLLPDGPDKESTKLNLIEASVKQMSGPSETDMVIANSTSVTTGSERLHVTQTLFVFPDGSHKIITRENLSKSLLRELPSLIDKRIKKL